MVSTRHHPRAFPPPQTPTSTTSSSKPTPDSPPPSSIRRAKSRKHKSVAPKTEEDEIKQIAEEAAKHTDELPVALATRSHTRSPRPTSSKSKSRDPTTAATGSYEHTPSPFLILWLLISLPLVIWDTAYILGRPHTMPGGRIHNYLWKPYALYGTVDHIYGWPAWDNRIGFPGAQGTLNAFETAFYIWYLVVMGKRVASGDGFVRGIALKSLNPFARFDENGRAKLIVRGRSDVATAVVVCFASFVMTLSKTLLYALNEYFSDWSNVRHNSWATIFWLWIMVNGAWLVVPTYMCYILGKEIAEAMMTTQGGRRPRTRDDDDQ